MPLPIVNSVVPPTALALNISTFPCLSKSLQEEDLKYPLWASLSLR